MGRQPLGPLRRLETTGVGRLTLADSRVRVRLTARVPLSPHIPEVGPGVELL